MPVRLKWIVAIVATGLGLGRAAPDSVKWHPGHYVFVGQAKLTDDLLTLPHFRGVQKLYTWRQLEPEPGRYDFAAVQADLVQVRRHGRQLVIQLTYKGFGSGRRNVPDYLAGPEYGGGVYRTMTGGYNPVLWNDHVGAQFDALIAAFGHAFDDDPNLEAVTLPETAPNARLATAPQEGVEPYSDAAYGDALKQRMKALRGAFPNTVVIQYTNYPVQLLDTLTDYEKEIGVGLGGPDVYPGEDAVSVPKTGVYRWYTKLAGIVPLGAAVQSENYSIAGKKRSAIRRGQTDKEGRPITIRPEDQKLIPVALHLQLARETLKLNYLFWAATPANCFENVKDLLAEPRWADDPAGGLETKLPAKAFAWTSDAK